MKELDQSPENLYPIRPSMQFIKIDNDRKQTDSFCLVLYALLTVTILGFFFYSFIREQ